MRVNYLILALLVAYSFRLHGQGNSYIDSLKTIESTTKNDSVRFEAISKLAIAYSDSAYEKSLLYWNKALAHAKKKSNRPSLAHAYHQIGFMFLKKGEFPLALENFKNALSVHEFIHNKKGMGQIFNDIGLVYKTWGRYELALESYISALNLFDDIGDDEGLAMTSNNIGQIYYYRDEYAKSIEYFERYLNVNKRNNRPRAVAGAANNIASAYLELKDYDKALDYYLKSLRIYDSLGVKFGIAIIQDNIGTLYSKKEQYQDALLYHNNALAIFKELNSKPRIGYVMMNIGLAHHKLNQHRNALGYLIESKNISEELNQRENLKEIYFNLTNVYSALADFEKALFFHQRFTHIKDSLMSIETSEKLSVMEAKYEADRKSRELVLVKNRLNQQKNAAYIATALGIMLIFLSFFLVRGNNLKSSMIKELNDQNKELCQAIIPIMAQRDSAEMLLKNTFTNHLVYYTESEKFADNFLWVKQKDRFVILMLIGFSKGGLTTDLRKVKSAGWFDEIVNKSTHPNPKNIVQGMLEMTVTYPPTGTTFTTCNTNFSCLVFDTESQSMAYYGHTPCWVRKGSEIEKIEPIDHKKNNECVTKSLDEGDSIFLIGVSTDIILDIDKDFKLIDSIDKAVFSSANEDDKSQKDLIISTIDYWKNVYGSNFQTIFVAVTI